MNSLLNTITLFNYMLVCFSSETSELGDVPDEVLSELYSQYKDAVADDNNTLLRRFFKRKNLHEIHVKKLKEVGGLKMHNLKIKEIGRSKSKPIEYIYINNPVESNIPKTFLTLEEFKENLYNRVKQQITVSPTNANGIKSKLYKTKMNKKEHKVNGTREINTIIIANAKNNTDLKLFTVNVPRNVKTLNHNKEINTKFMKTIKKMPSTMTITKIFSKLGYTSDNRISHVFQNVHSNISLNTTTQKSTTIKVISKPTSTSKDGMILENTYITLEETYSKITPSKTSIKDTPTEKETVLNVSIRIIDTITMEAITKKETPTKTMVTPKLKPTSEDTTLLETGTIKFAPREYSVAISSKALDFEDIATEKATITNNTQNSKLISEDITTLEINTVTETPREMKVTTIKVTPKRKPTLQDTPTEESRTIEVTPRRRPILEDTITEPTTSNNETPRRNPAIRFTWKPKTTSTVTRTRRSTLGRPLVYMAG